MKKETLLKECVEKTLAIAVGGGWFEHNVKVRKYQANYCTVKTDK